MDLEQNLSPSDKPPSLTPDFATAPGEAAALLRATDWSQTPLGPIDRWPDALRVAVGICLNSRFPMFVWWGPDLINIYNDAYAPMLGKRHPEAMGRPAANVWADIWAVVGAQADAVMRRGEATWNDRVPLMMERNGYAEEAWFTWSYSPILDGAGGVAGLFCAVTEETQRVRAEQERDRMAERWKRADEQSRTILESITDAFFALDRDWRFTYVNAQAQALLARAAEDLLGKVVWDEYPALRGTAFEQSYRRAAAGRVPDSVTEFYPDHYRWYEVHAYPAPDGGLLIYFRDVSERVRAEDERAALTARLKRQTRLFDTALSSTPDYVFMFDPQARFVYANATLLALWGRTAERALGRTMRELNYPPDVEAQLLRDIARVIETRAAVLNETPYTSETGAGGVFEYTLAPMIAPDGSVELIVGMSRDVTARKEAAAERERLLAALGNQRARLARIVEQAPAFICTLRGPSHVFELANERYYDLVGRRELIGRTVREAVPEFAAQGFLELLDAVYRTGETFVGTEMPVDMHNPDGGPADRRYLNFVYQALREADGSVSGIFVHGVDVTETVRAREGLRASERRFRELADAMPQIVWTVTPGSVADYYNRQWQDYTGLPADDVGERWREAIHPDDLGRVRERWESCMRTGEPFDLELRIRRASDGAYRWFLGRALPVREADGRIVRWIGTDTDIHDKKRAEDLAREQSRVVETINQVGRSVAAELDVGKLVQTVTDATTELTGAQFGAFFYNVTDAHGESYALFALAGVDRANFERFPMPRNTAIFGPTFQGEGVVRLADVTADPRYGKNPPYNGLPPGHLPVRSYLSVPVVSRSGEVLGGLFMGHERPGVFTDRHEQLATGIAAQAAVAIDNARLFDAARRANAEKDALLAGERAARGEAERAGRMKDEFLATLSHELRTPLNAILGWAQVLASGPRDDEDLAEGLRTIERNARTQGAIIDDLLDMSRIMSGKLRLDVRQVDLLPVVRAAMDTVRPAADAKGVLLQAVTPAPDAGRVWGDPNRLQQVFWNLLANAVKFTPRGGSVRVLLERAESHLDVSFIDTGEGITPEFLPHVFGRFRQADASSTRRHGGLGLGLAIVKHLIEQHGGSVRAASDGPGRGATFVVSLPLMAVRADGQPPEDPPHPVPGATPRATEPCLRISGVKVLVVDDEPDARALVRRLLEDCGAVVSTAGSASEALEKLAADRPDVLVSDIGMPGEDGYTLIRRVRALGADGGGRVPALALTAYARAEDRTRAILAGFQMHAVKPAEPAELIAMIASLAGRVGLG